MTSIPAANAVPSAPRGARVIDAPMRVFHWLFAACFTGAWLTAEGESWRLVHETLGYTLVGLLVCRLLYGVVGPRRARLGGWGRKLSAVGGWLTGLASGRVEGVAGVRQGAQVVMGAAMVLLLVGAVPLLASGVAMAQDWVAADWLSDALEEGHEWLGNALLALALAHVALLVGLSLLRRRNLALPMLTGRSDVAGPDAVRHNRTVLAALVLLAALGFMVWQVGTSDPSASAHAAVGAAPVARAHPADADDDD